MWIVLRVGIVDVIYLSVSYFVIWQNEFQQIIENWGTQKFKCQILMYEQHKIHAFAYALRRRFSYCANRNNDEAKIHVYT